MLPFGKSLPTFWIKDWPVRGGLVGPDNIGFTVSTVGCGQGCKDSLSWKYLIFREKPAKTMPPFQCFILGLLILCQFRVEIGRTAGTSQDICDSTLF